MVKKIFFGVLVICLLLPMVMASTTTINVKTIPGHNVEVAVSDGTIADYSQIKRFKDSSFITDEYGDISFDLSTNKQKLNLFVYVKQDSETVISEKYYGEDAGGDILIELAPSWFEFIATPTEPEVNETIIELNETETLEEILEETEEIPVETLESNKSLFAGFTIFKETEIFTKKNFLYTMLAILVLGAVVFYILKRNKTPREIKITKLSDLQAEKKDKIEDYKDTIEEAEKKIKEAQDTINSLKKDNRIKEAKRKLMEDERELIKLRQEE